ncbi:MAG TPA: hypothetical protein VGO61_11145 [Steroidobacteraceae bacterium]|jgi:hypothetical protein|nr:hypothetical protein [Steroidobacteraceae bacterium]
MILVQLCLGILFVTGLIVLAFRPVAGNAGRGLLVAGLLLTVSLLALNVVLRVGFSFDLARGHVALPSFDGAPIMPLLGAVLLIASGMALITLIVALVLLARIWSQARPAPLLMFAPLIPPLLVLGFLFLTAASDAAAGAM